MNSDLLARLLQPPATACWQDVGTVWTDLQTGDLLLRLPSLTNLTLFFIENAVQVSFLPQLPRLISLDLECHDPHEGVQQAWFIPADAVLASLLLCPDLTELNTTCGFNSAHWTALFDKLTKLKKLRINGSLESLQCFTACPIAESLEELSLWGELHLSPSEISRLYGLRRLRSLFLESCFTPHLSDAMIDNLSPPTPILPTLTYLSIRWRTFFGALKEVDRKGPSFEWMQQQWTL